MKKFTFFLTALFVVMACVVASCGKSSDGGDDTTVSEAKYLTADEFAKSTWKGDKYNVKLVVSSKTAMTLTYTVDVPVSKNAGEETKEETKTVQITYQFSEKDGSFSGSGDDNGSYSGILTSKTAMTFKLKDESLLLSKQ